MGIESPRRHESLTIVPDLDASTVSVTVNYLGGRNPRATAFRVLDGNKEVTSITFAMIEFSEVETFD